MGLYHDTAIAFMAHVVWVKVSVRLFVSGQ